MLETVNTNNEQVIALRYTEVYTGHLFNPNAQLHAPYQQMEPEIRAPEWKFAKSTCYLSQKEPYKQNKL